jgi:lysophospholipase L1-like esterase
MKTHLIHVLVGAFALTALSLLGCSSDTNTPLAGSGGSSGGANSSGGASTSPASSGGAATTGGEHASGGQTPSQGGAAQGGAATGGSTPSAAGQLATGGSASGGQAGGGSATGGSDTGGGKTDGGTVGGTTAGDAAAGGKTAMGGTPSGGTKVGGATATGGATPTGGGLGSSNGTTPITVWMSGDSTMAGDKCAGGGWGDQFGSLFNTNVTVVNRSVAGRSIQTWLYEGNVSSTAGANGECTLTGTTYSANWNAMLDANTGMKKGDYLFIEFGINDGDGTCPRHVGTALFETYLTTMAKAASDRGAETIFLTSTSAIACNGSTAQANRGFGPQTKAAGAADGVPVIDMTVLTANLYTSLGLCPNAGDYTSTTSKLGLFFCNDHTHFEAAGALQIAQTAATALKNQGIGLASYLKN